MPEPPPPPEFRLMPMAWLLEDICFPSWSIALSAGRSIVYSNSISLLSRSFLKPSISF
jgi:hypothetical protein